MLITHVTPNQKYFPYFFSETFIQIKIVHCLDLQIEH